MNNPNYELNNKLKAIINELVLLAQAEKQITLTSTNDIEVAQSYGGMTAYGKVIQIIQNKIVTING